MITKAMLLVNLGSPDSYDPKDVKRYLNEFLMDERVIDINPLGRKILVQGIILNTRPKKSAAAYKSIWWDEGSPLTVLSKRLVAAVRQHTQMPVELGMRYGNPSIHAGLKAITEKYPDVSEVFVVPLYPQFAMSTTETVIEKANTVAAAHYPNLKLTYKMPFYNEERYIKVLAASIKPAIDAPFDHILFSYHGVPERHIKKSDCTGKHCLTTKNCCQVQSPAHAACYRQQCYATTDLVARQLGLRMDQFSVSFQSRLGLDPWLKPFTDETLVSFGKIGMQRLLVVCPAFVSDCLETLEEIAEEGKHEFEAAGGGAFQMVPCLNDRSDWAALIAEWAAEFSRA